METLKQLYKIGYGPSSSHTMGPGFAAEKFKTRTKNLKLEKYRVTLYGSLALTGEGHLIDKVLKKYLGDDLEIIMHPELFYEYHPNGMLFEALNNSQVVDSWLVFSVGGGSLKELNEPRDTKDIYPLTSMKEIMNYCEVNFLSFDEYVKEVEGASLIPYLKTILDQMFKTVEEGLYTGGILQGGLMVERKAPSFYNQYLQHPSFEKLIYAASLAVAETNAAGGVVVTAPTCGSSGVVPGVLYAEKYYNHQTDEKLINALIIGGLVGNLAKANGSISGAEVGCQGEIGVACSMASAMEAYLHGGNMYEIEYAAEIALEHHLGMTCDPVKGLVQIPCIERNAIAARQAVNSSDYAILTNGVHHISLDEVIDVMKKTGKDLQAAYRETALGGLAAETKE